MKDFTSQICGLSGSTQKVPIQSSQLSPAQTKAEMQNFQLTSVEYENLGHQSNVGNIFNESKLQFKVQKHLNSSVDMIQFKPFNYQNTSEAYQSRRNSLMPENQRDSLMCAATLGLRDFNNIICSRSTSGSRGRGAFKDKCDALKSQIDFQ